MQSTFRFGRIAGVEVGANWSWLLVVVLIVWVLAAGVFPESSPGLSDGAYLAMASVAAVLFFASLLLHELGHAVQARREGMELDGITLWVFGGVAKFRGQFPSAGAELRIAIAGPLVSLALGVAFLALAEVGEWPEEVHSVLFWLGSINLILLAFNLLPALPLDGGRVLRALLWARRGDFGAATRSAARLGRLFGQVLIGWGLLVAIFGGAIGGLWLAFIGWFVLMAAESEAQLAAAQTTLGGLRVADVMVADPVTAHPDLTLREFMDRVFLAHRHTAYPVTEGPRALGIVSFRQVADAPEARWDSERLAERMVPLAEALVVAPTAPLAEVLPELAGTSLRRALVCEGDRLVGLLSITDTARVLEAFRGQPAR